MEHIRDSIVNFDRRPFGSGKGYALLCFGRLRLVLNRRMTPVQQDVSYSIERA